MSGPNLSEFKIIQGFCPFCGKSYSELKVKRENLPSELDLYIEQMRSSMTAHMEVCVYHPYWHLKRKCETLEAKLKGRIDLHA